MSTKAYGRILMWEGASLWIFSAPAGEKYPKTAVHAHHVLQLTFALTGRVDFEGGRECVGGEAVAIAPDAPHTFEADGLTVHLFVESDSVAGRSIVRSLCAERPISAIPQSVIDDFCARFRATLDDPQHTDDALRSLGRGLITSLSGSALRAQAPDPRIRKVIAWVGARLDQALSLNDVAELVELSPGRMRHLFVEQTGLSFRTYLLWLRLLRAVEMFAEGASLTAAAHASGFADSAHLSRTFRRMFGINANSLRIGSQQLK